VVRRATHMTGQLTFDDCAPDWPSPVDHQPDDHTPSRFDLRQDEMHDLRDQHAGPVALWTAHTIDVGSYL
jgi:hypothetical protein